MTVLRAVDFETTGEPTEEVPQAICEVGWCDVTAEGAKATLGAIRGFVVNPGRPMPPEARAVHHITDEELADAPPPDVAFRELMGSPRPDYFVAHNADFEQKFFGGGGIPWICTYKVALRLWPDLEKHGLQYLRYALSLDIIQECGLPAHRAQPDAYVGAAMMARIIEEDRVSFDDMVRWSKGPALLPRIGFGKHKGERWEDVPADYLKWIVEKSDLDRDAKANARHHLKLRGKL